VLYSVVQCANVLVLLSSLYLNTYGHTYLNIFLKLIKLYTESLCSNVPLNILAADRFDLVHTTENATLGKLIWGAVKVEISQYMRVLKGMTNILVVLVMCSFFCLCIQGSNSEKLKIGCEIRLPSRSSKLMCGVLVYTFELELRCPLSTQPYCCWSRCVIRNAPGIVLGLQFNDWKFEPARWTLYNHPGLVVCQPLLAHISETDLLILIMC